MEVLNVAPQIGSFVPLTEHESTTPASFYTGPPVLHYYSDRCKLIVLEDELDTAPALAHLVSKSSSPTHSNETNTNGEGMSTGEKELEDIDVWVTSEKLLLYSTSHSTGLSIPYQAISLHAIQSLPLPDSSEPQSQGLYMQLIPNTPAYENEDDDLPDTISVTIVPTASAPPPSTAPTANVDDAIEFEDKPEQTPVMALFTALSNCANLHPDPIDPEDEEMDGVGSRLMQAGLALPGMSDGGLPPPMPGSGGWITAENMHEFVDEEGNWIGGDENEEMETTESLGPGAGTVRTREEDNNHSTGNAEDHDDTKWQRTS